MLSLLHIENIAVIESADISFNGGFNVLTGETGAGKSIVIDAISAILGERAYRDMIRTGTNRALARGVFTDVPRLTWFEEYGVEYDSEVMIHREIYADGRNVCKVNGTNVTVSILNKLGLQLINIHGQHDSATLLNDDNHLPFLDAFSDDEDLLSEYRGCYRVYKDLQHQIESLQMDEGEKLRRTETLQYQIAEIEKADLQMGEDEQLSERRKLLQNAEKLSDGIHCAVECLCGGDESYGAASLLMQAERELGKLARYTDAFGDLQAKLSDLMYQVQDAAEEARDACDGLTYSADELENIESRLDVIYRLRKKYGADCAEILDYLEKARQELNSIRFSDEKLEQLQVELGKAEKKLTDCGWKLREKRQEKATQLNKRIQDELSQMDMPNVRFSCEFAEKDFSADGMDSVSFYLSANAGEALKPLSKVASGGELARIMLAMKNVLAQKDRVPTLIFDEVDTGVSGRAAQRVAEKLKEVASHKQVLCVTHLPQMAALADTHFLISKAEKDGRTFTSVTPLDREGRKRELARIIGGKTITENTLKSAEEMLS